MADLQASLHGRSILGPRGTAAYIQTLGRLENQIGITEYDVLVSHCQREIYRRHANHPTAAIPDAHRQPTSILTRPRSPEARGEIGCSIRNARVKS